jgi:hypothetical protein
MYDLYGYITKRAMDRDDAEADGTYDTWPEILIDLPSWERNVYAYWAMKEGVDVDDLICAVVEKRAVEFLREHYGRWIT